MLHVKRRGTVPAVVQRAAEADGRGEPRGRGEVRSRAARGLAAAQEGPRRRGARGGEEGVEGERGSARCGGRAEDADEREAGQRRRLQPQGEHARGVQARDFADVD